MAIIVVAFFKNLENPHFSRQVCISNHNRLENGVRILLIHILEAHWDEAKLHKDNEALWEYSNMQWPQKEEM